MSQLQRARAELARRSFKGFVDYTFPKYVWNWHHLYTADVLQRWAHCEPGYEHLVITQPPRRGKSELASRRLPAWIMGNWPDREIIAASYSDDLATKMSRDTQRIIRSPEYADVFPDFQFGEKRTQAEFETAAGGTYKAAGVGSGITGRGANHLIIDDPTKSRKDAESATLRDDAWEWFNDDAYSRLVYPFSVLVMATRWHYDDMIGRIIDGPDAGIWHVIHFPEINDWDPHEQPEYDPREPGEALWAGYYDNPRSDLNTPELQARAIEHFERKKARNPYGVLALEQGRPAPKEGNLIKTAWCRRYSKTPAEMLRHCDRLLITVDAAFKGNPTSDRCALMLVGTTQQNIIVLDERVGLWSYSRLKRELIEFWNKYMGAMVVIEDKANGTALLDELDPFIRKLKPFVPDKYGDKDTRAQLLADQISCGRWYWPEEHNAPWVADHLLELTQFPSARYDDRVDAASMAAIELGQRRDPFLALKRLVNAFG